MFASAWQTVWTLLGLLWAQGMWTVVTVLGWMIGMTVFGTACVVGLWFLGRRFGWIGLGVSWDRWPRGILLAVWVISFPPLLAWTGLVVGCERAILAILVDEHTVSRLCGGAAGVVVEPIIDQAAGEGATRVSMHRVWEMRASADQTIDGMQAGLIERAGVDPEQGLVGRAKYYVADRVLDRAKTSLIGDESSQVDAYLHELDKLQDDDGMVSSDDFVAVLATRFIEPPIVMVVQGLFSPLKAPAQLLMAALLLLPLLGMAAIRWVVRWRWPSEPDAPAMP